MFGYACNETDVLMPAPIHYSHKILRLMAEDRKSGKLKNIEPDSKSQITIEYKDGKPSSVKSVVISTQHSADVNQSQVRELVKPYIDYVQKNQFPNITINSAMTSLSGTFLNVQPYIAVKLQLLDRMGLRMTAGFNAGTINEGEWRTEDRKPILDSPETVLNSMAIRAMIYFGL